MRRLVYIHTAGQLSGLRQIIGVIHEDRVVFNQYAKPQTKMFDKELPDVLAAVSLAPDWRQSRAMRLKSTDTYVVYKEIAGV